MKSPKNNTINSDPPTWDFWGHEVRAPSQGLLHLQAALMASEAFKPYEKKKIPCNSAWNIDPGLGVIGIQY